MGLSRNRKRLSYRDQGGASQAAHVAHWEGFTFTGGPWRVVLAGAWGQPQVWASSAAEGKRVLLHAASIAGYDPGSDPTAEWQICEVRNGRHPAGKVFGVRVGAYGPCVSKRRGPEGQPEFEPLT
jgi:hypothetical protein